MLKIRHMGKGGGGGSGRDSDKYFHNRSNAEATYVQSTKTHNFLKTT